MVEFYYVGGCVRDQLLGLKPNDVDYLVVGSTPEDMIASGYQQVGADFPVFLNPTTGEEYALARTERKSGKGYSGFVVDSSPSITLEEDLRRRDLTINAMAKCVKTDKLFDPYGGQRDLYDGVIRHVSEAFAEDPLRVLRAARFSARYGFSVAAETMELMKQVVPELEHVSRERIVVEMYKILNTPRVRKAYQVLNDCGAFELPCMSKFNSQRLDKIDKMGNAGFLALYEEERFALLSDSFGKQDLIDALIPVSHAHLSTAFNASVGLISHYDYAQPEQKIALFNHLRAFSAPETIKSCVRIMTEAQMVSIPTANRITIDLKKAKAVDVSSAPLIATGSEIRKLVDSMRMSVL